MCSVQTYRQVHSSFLKMYLRETMAYFESFEVLSGGHTLGFYLSSLHFAT